MSALEKRRIVKTVDSPNKVVDMRGNGTMQRIKKSGSVRKATLLGCIALGLPWANPALSQSRAPAAGAPDDGEIIVTAQKREQRLQDVPSSIVAISTAKLEAQGGDQLADLVKVVPGLVLIGGGAPGTGKPIIRGISSGNDRVSLVGLYVDDTPFTPSSPRAIAADQSFDPALADIERVEVLKGPQSTLYGASTMGGLIKYITKKPNLAGFEASGRFGASQVDGGDAGYNVRLSANAPIVADRIGLRVSAFYRRDGGYVDDVYKKDNNINDSSIKGVRASLLIKVNEDIETIFTGLVQSIHNDAVNYVFLDRPSLAFTFGKLALSSPIDTQDDFRFHSLANTTTVDLPFGKFSNAISYAGFFSDVVVDGGAFVPSVGGGPNNSAVQELHRRSKRITDEARLTSSPGRFEWMLGAFYTNDPVGEFAGDVARSVVAEQLWFVPDGGVVAA
jgi:outer membrane receptor protein involved in Fe transport